MDKFRFELDHISVEEEDDARADDIEFYETIQAPKFVDFTRPNHFSPDDRYWFCSRLGCNQKHEEEMSSEAIYKDFVLRVMAARSPNVRFQRALTRKNPSDSKKYPISVPPKTSKSRIPRLALVSSVVSKKLVVDLGKAKNIPTPAKPASTPKARVKIVPAKYMTSPRKKNGGSLNLKAFQSVRNQKKTSITMQKNRVVAKALLFSSPKKTVKVKPPELSTPVAKLCEGVKKLQIRSVKKGIVQKPLKESTSVRKLLPSKVVAFKANQQDENSDDSVPKEKRHGDDSSDMEIDEKSGDGSLELCTEMVELEIEEKHDGSSNDSNSGTFQKEPSSSSERSLTAGNLTNDLISVASSEQKCSEQQNVKATRDLYLTVQNSNERCTSEADKENAIRCTAEDDKENALNSNDIRKVNGNNLSKHGAPVKSKVKKNRKLQNGEKNSEDKCPAAITNEVKYKKLKPTNPKPFRLRTDERGVLKEAYLERKAHFPETSTTSENSQNIGVSAVTEKVSEKVEDKTVKKVRFISVKSKYKKTSKEAEPLSVLCSENKMGRAKSYSLQNEIVRPQRKNESQVKPKGDTLTEEDATTTSTTKESRQEPRKEASVQTNEASTYHKLASQRRKPTTVPRGPKFQTLNKPKSCTRNT